MNDHALGCTARWAAGAPLSPIDGVPFALKDIYDTAGIATEGGEAINLSGLGEIPMGAGMPKGDIDIMPGTENEIRNFQTCCFTPGINPSGDDDLSRRNCRSQFAQNATQAAGG